MRTFSYSDVGRRNNNEDFIEIGNHVFVLCDGVGGKEKGEVASSFVASSVVRKSSGVNHSFFSEQFVHELIAEVQKDLNLYADDNPTHQGMGTTLCAAFVSNDEILLAHIGDSRIYFIIPDEKKYWRTTDHSIVAELVQSGIIDDKDAKRHYLSNHITRAIQAVSGLEPVKADMVSLKSVKKGTLLFLCSDGVQEAWNDEDMINVLCDSSLPIDGRFEIIKSKCRELSSDNNSAILIEFEHDDWMSENSVDGLIWKYLPSHENKLNDRKDNRYKNRNKTIKGRPLFAHSNTVKLAMSVFVLLLLVIFLLLLKLRSS